MVLRGLSSLLTADFYRAFENKYRGARELIRSRLHVYPVLAAARGDAFRLFSPWAVPEASLCLEHGLSFNHLRSGVRAASNAEEDALIAKVPRCAGQSFQCCG